MDPDRLLQHVMLVAMGTLGGFRDDPDGRPAASSPGRDPDGRGSYQSAGMDPDGGDGDLSADADPDHILQQSSRFVNRAAGYQNGNRSSWRPWRPWVRSAVAGMIWKTTGSVVALGGIPAAVTEI